MDNKIVYKYGRVILAMAIFLLPLNSFALEQHTKQWFAVNAQQTLDKEKHWRAIFYSQLRLIDQSHVWQAILFEGGISYQLNTDNSFGFGYRWAGNNPFNDFYQTNRFFQQFIYQKKLSSLYRFVLRTRLEEISRGNSSQVALRIRERFATVINHAIFKNAFPFLYDEVFFQLNHPAYMPHTFVGENRVFIGFNLMRSEKAWWEIGYINQYQIRTPNQSQDQMSHILSFTYNFA